MSEPTWPSLDEQLARSRGRRIEGTALGRRQVAGLAAAAREHPRSAGVVALRQEQLGWIGHLAQAAARHLEHADLVGRPEPVLHSA